MRPYDSLDHLVFETLQYVELILGHALKHLDEPLSLDTPA
jgi:hypothetical protein